MSARAKLTEERKRAADVIRRFESGEPERLAQAVEYGNISAWEAMVEIHILPAVATIDALCRLRVVEAWAEGRTAREAAEQEDAPALCPCGDRLATMAGYCDECRADARDPGEP